jgi:hypothetical protein
LGSDHCTLCAQQWHNTKAHWGGIQCVGSTPMCLGIVSLLCIVSVLIDLLHVLGPFTLKSENQS